ncbi:MAG: dicarboxylate/amino acid:cation symporter [bacterium]|nr:dicarboxylate/amino acid:cation symporter [bacterium]
MAAGALLGGVFGWVAPERAAQVGILGELWLLPLRMTVIPLIVFSVVHGVSSIGDSGRLGRLGSATAIYYLGTTACAIGLGVVAVTVIAPGEGVDLLGAATPDVATSAAGRTDWQDVLRNLLSPNLVASATAGDLVPLILFALAFGIALSMIGDRGRPVSELVEGVFAAILKMVHGIILLGPIGVFGLVAARLGAAGGSEGIVALLTGLGWFTLTVVGGLAIHGILTLGLVLTLVARRDPFAYARDLGTPLTTAFATASSSATLPLTLDAVEEAGVDANVSRFVLPLGATVNMDGSALYEAVAAVFIAQAVGVDLDAGAMVALFVTATLSTIGAAGIPEAGLVTMVVVLEAVGLPLEGLGLLLAIDWLIDRFRTAVNVWGDAVGAAAVGAVVGDAGER